MSTRSDKTDSRKRRMLKALEKCYGIVTDASKIARVTRQTHYEWLKNDREYKEAVEDISNIEVDVVESKLFEEIEKNNITAIIFYLKTKGKRRGYVERREYDHTTKGESFKGSVDLTKMSDEQLRRLEEQIEQVADITGDTAGESET